MRGRAAPLLVCLLALVATGCSSLSLAERHTKPPPYPATRGDTGTSLISIPPATVPPPATSAPTTTATTAPLPPCMGSQFAASVTTSSPSYSVGDTIPITLQIENAGPACLSGQGNANVLNGCPYITASSNGTVVWVNGISPPGPMCLAFAVGTAPIPHGWSDSYPFSWAQDECPNLAGCSQAQVPSGTYTIALGGAGRDAWVGVTVKPAVITIG